MNSYLMCGLEQRARVEKILDNIKASVLEKFDAGQPLTIHTHNTLEPMSYHSVAFDFLYKGWTFGVSFGDFPRVGDK